MHTATAASMTSDTELKPSDPYWEGVWSKGLGKGDKWDTGVVSPALQDLLHTGARTTSGETSMTY